MAWGDFFRIRNPLRVCRIEGTFLLLDFFPHPIKSGVVGVEILGIEAVLGDAEGIEDFSVSNRMEFFVDG